MKENLTYEESVVILRENLGHFTKSSKFLDLIQSLGKEEDLIKLLTELNSLNDKNALIKFVDSSKPKYTTKTETDIGLIYTYNDRKIGTPTAELILAYGLIEEAHSKNFDNAPTLFFTSSSTKLKFISFTQAINYLNKTKNKKISFVIPNKTAETA